MSDRHSLDMQGFDLSILEGCFTTESFSAGLVKDQSLAYPIPHSSKLIHNINTHTGSISK